MKTKFNKISEIYSLINRFEGPNNVFIQKAINYQNNLLKPQNSLGLLEDLSIFFCGWQKQIKPRLKKIQTLIFAGNHGVCEQKVNSYPQKLTLDMIKVFTI